jgi:hexaprenyl-diphosphate synthase
VAGKKLRPAMVLLTADAINAHMDSCGSSAGPTTYLTDGLPPGWAAAEAALASATQALHPSEAAPLHAAAVAGAAAAAAMSAAAAAPLTPRMHLPSALALPLQRRLAEITEMIHTASLLHDDVVDASDMRRGVPSASALFGNKLAVLAGDFMLARSSVCLSRLRRCGY